MECITEAILENLANDLIANPSLKLRMDYLDDHQPSVLLFAMEAMEKHDSSVGIQATMLSWFAVAAFEAQSDNPLPPLSLRTLVHYARQNRDLFENTKLEDLSDFMEVMALETSAQPYVMEFIRQSVAQSLNIHGTDKVRETVEVYLTAKTIVDALDAAGN